MLRTDFLIKVTRKMQSYNYKFNRGIETFDNNIQNNCIDFLELLQNANSVYKMDVQSVANYPGGDVNDTINAGDFFLSCFVDGGVNTFIDPTDTNKIRIHGIVNAKNLTGNPIKEDSHIYYSNGIVSSGRVLLHSTYLSTLHNSTYNRDYPYAYSMACIIAKYTKSLIEFNNVLTSAGVLQGDMIPVTLIEV